MSNTPSPTFDRRGLILPDQLHRPSVTLRIQPHRTVSAALMAMVHTDGVPICPLSAARAHHHSPGSPPRRACNLRCASGEVRGTTSCSSNLAGTCVPSSTRRFGYPTYDAYVGAVMKGCVATSGAVSCCMRTPPTGRHRRGHRSSASSWSQIPWSPAAGCPPTTRRSASCETAHCLITLAAVSPCSPHSTRPSSRRSRASRRIATGTSPPVGMLSESDQARGELPRAAVG